MLDALGERTGRAVILAARRSAQLGRRQVLKSPRALAEHAHPICDDASVLALRVPDDVIVEHGGDIPSARLGSVGEQFAAPQPLLLARKYGVDNRGVVPVLRQDPRRFHDEGNARRVVVRAGRLAGRVHCIRISAIDMPCDDDDMAGVAGSALDCQHILDDDALRRTRPIKLSAGPVERDAMVAGS